MVVKPGVRSSSRSATHLGSLNLMMMPDLSEWDRDALRRCYGDRVQF